MEYCVRNGINLPDMYSCTKYTDCSAVHIYIRTRIMHTYAQSCTYIHYSLYYTYLRDL